MNTKVIVLLLCCVLIINGAFGQKNSKNSIKLKFLLEGKMVEVDKDFNVYFIAQTKECKTIIKPKIEADSFIYPDLCNFDLTLVYIVFKYRNKAFTIGTVNKVYDENMTWVVGVDKKPYVRNYNTSYLNKKEKDIDGILYVEFESINHEGYVTTVGVTNWDQYFKESMRFLEIDYRPKTYSDSR